MLLFFLVSVVAAPSVAHADEHEMVLPRHAAVTPDGKSVVFSYGGDLFLASSAGGAATRLTADAATDDYPIINADGTELVFASDRDGAASFDLYSMPVQGGPTRRLTWDSAYDRPLCFSPKGDSVLFQSYRRNGDLERYGVFRQNLENPREPELFIDAAFGSLQPIADTPGHYLAQRGGVSWWRKGYQGSAAAELYRIDAANGTFDRLTTNTVRDRWPLSTPQGETIWVSGQGSEVGEVANLFIRGAKGPARALTSFKEDGVRHPAMSRDGRVIVFERGLSLYRIERTRSGFGKPKKLTFHARADLPTEVTWRRQIQEAEEVVPSRDGKVIAFVAEGELYVRRVMDGTPVRVTNSASRESSPIFSHDNKAIYFISDRGGERALYKVHAAEGEDPRLHRALGFDIDLVYAAKGQPVFRPQLTPDGLTLAFVRGGGELCLLDVNPKQKGPKEPRTLFSGWDAPIYSFSPDSKWIAYARENDDFNTDIFVS
ncbi:MAG: hypothetical protein ACYS22_11195, partial [Planctomycetota bacterium]